MAFYDKMLWVALLVGGCRTTSGEVALPRPRVTPVESARVESDEEPSRDAGTSNAAPALVQPPPNPPDPPGRCLVLRVGPLRDRPEFDYTVTYVDLQIVRPRELVRGQRLRVNFGMALTETETATFKTGLLYKAFVGDDVIFGQTVPGDSGFVRASDIRVDKILSTADVDSACPE
jgi:hypothetical protein